MNDHEQHDGGKKNGNKINGKLRESSNSGDKTPSLVCSHNISGNRHYHNDLIREMQRQEDRKTK